MVSVFGSAGPRPEDADYQAGVRLGAALARAGHAIQTGGYMGLMEAVSRGAAEAGGHVIGVTSRAIEAFRPTAANPWVAEELKTDSLHERLDVLTRSCHAAVVLPGGVGTLTELSLIWNRVMVGELQDKPIIAVGAPWGDLLAVLDAPPYVAAEHHALVRWVPAVEAVAPLVDAFFADRP